MVCSHSRATGESVTVEATADVTVSATVDVTVERVSCTLLAPSATSLSVPCTAATTGESVTVAVTVDATAECHCRERLLYSCSHRRSATADVTVESVSCTATPTGESVTADVTVRSFLYSSNHRGVCHRGCHCKVSPVQRRPQESLSL